MPSFIHLYHVHTLPMLQNTLLPWVPSPPLAHIAIELTSPSLPEPSRPLPFPNPLILAHRSPQLNNQCQHGARPNNPHHSYTYFWPKLSACIRPSLSRKMTHIILQVMTASLVNPCAGSQPRAGSSGPAIASPCHD